MLETTSQIAASKDPALPRIKIAERFHPKSFLRPSDQKNRFRAGRMQHVRQMIQDILAVKQTCEIIDIGGLPSYWEAFGPDIVQDPRVTITLVNVDYDENFDAGRNAMDRPRLKCCMGDARKLDGFGDKTFDLAHSNSVIEHVGCWTDMWAMADEVRRVARNYFVQTPYWGFPVEPHNRTPLFHWLPEQARYRAVMRFNLGFWTRSGDVDTAMRLVQSAALLDRGQFGALFPSASIYSEIVWGMTKSLVALGGDARAVDPATNTRRLRL